MTISFRTKEPSDVDDLTGYKEVMNSPGDVCAPVLVAQLPEAHDHQGIFGEGAALGASAAGYVGAVIAGGCRDTRELRDMGFPVFCRAVAPGNIMRSVEVESVGEPVRIGRTEIRNGDIIIADNDGVVAADPADLGRLLEKAEAVQEWERKVFAAMRDGLSMNDAVESAGPMPE